MSSKLFRIEIIQPKFDEIYSKFQNTCDIDSWANTVQEKGIKNLRAGKDIDENLPDLFQLSDEDLLNTTDKKKPLEPDKNKLESYAVRESIELWVNPIAKKVESGKIPYEKDGFFYSLWKYANASRLTGKSLITFTDLAPLEGNQRFTTFEFLNSLRGLNIELENITFHEDIYKKFCKTEHKYITEYAAKYIETDSGKTIKKLFKNQAKFSDILGLLGRFDELFKIKVQLDGLLEFIEFSPAPSEKNIKPLKKWLGIYLQCLIEDKLFSEDLKNFYRFIRQKEIFLDHIKTEVRDYGLEFVFRQGGVISVQREGSVSIGEDKSYLFIHTLAALERQGFFEIERIFITDMDVPPEKQTDDYKVKIVASEKLLDEYRQKTIYIPAHTKSLKERSPEQQEKTSTPHTFVISVKDREIRVNDYLLSKPHAVGKNLDLFGFIRTKPKKSIRKSTLPDYLKSELKEKRFSKILYELGFRGEVLKAFFPKRGKSIFWYSGDEITVKEMEENGIKINQFLKELKIADVKNRPV